MNRIILFFIVGTLLFCQCKTPKGSAKSLIENKGQRFCRVMFYNTENLFFPTNDSLINDDEFIADGVCHWTFERYNTKLINIYKVMTAVGEGSLPDIAGFCEIENKQCLIDLVSRTPLSQYNYQIIHFDSPDARGIDVGLIYRANNFTMLYSKAIRIVFPNELSNRTTRDILYVRGIIKKTDTINLFINHWPSKRGGAVTSDPLRMFVARQLKFSCDTVYTKHPNAKVIIMGDFNDEPDAKSINEGLLSKHTFDSIDPTNLYNLSYNLQYKQHLWTNKFQDHAGIIDQIIVSGTLLKSTIGINTTIDAAHISQKDFLFVDDEKYLGKKLFRTYIGMKYNGGFSDHLPVYLDLFR